MRQAEKELTGLSKSPALEGNGSCNRRSRRRVAAGLGVGLIAIDLMSNGVSSRSMIKAGLGFAVIGLSVSGVGAPAALAISLAYAALDGSGEIDRELDRWGVAR